MEFAAYIPFWQELTPQQQARIAGVIEYRNVKKGAKISNSIIMGDTVVGEDAVIEYSIIDENVCIGNNVKIGQPKEDGKGIAVVGRGVVVEDGATVNGGLIIDKDVMKEGK